MGLQSLNDTLSGRRGTFWLTYALLRGLCDPFANVIKRVGIERPERVIHWCDTESAGVVVKPVPNTFHCSCSGIQRNQSLLKYARHYPAHQSRRKTSAARLDQTGYQLARGATGSERGRESAVLQPLAI